MHHTRVQQCLFLLVFSVVAQLCSCVFNVQVRKSSEEKPQLALPRVSCSARRMKAAFNALVRSNVHVRDSSGAAVPVLRSEEACGVRLSRDQDQSLSFFSAYDSCYAQTQGSKVVVSLQVQLKGADKWFRVNISCPLIKRHNERKLILTPSPGNCDADIDLRVACGHQSVSSEACSRLGCCYDSADFSCYYRLNDCSLDGHVVFSVKAADASVDPGSLIIKDHPQCFPVVTTSDAAVFKIGVTDCGAKRTVHGAVVTYEVDVEEQQTPWQRSPFSLQVQCEYEAAADLRSLYTVTNPPPVAALGSMNVQMKIATDESFSSFLPEDQLPLTLPLREAAYVEVSIAQPSPDPTLSLRVRDCFAYPASRHSVWTLLYDGCPNPLDNLRSSVPVDSQGEATSHSQVRRFDVKTFAFLDPETGRPSVEEIYFYCWVEICTADVDCAQSCAIISSESERRRREATSEYDRVQLLSLGPLLLEQNSSKPDDLPCVKQQKFQRAVYLLSGVGAVLLLVVLFTVWPCIKKCGKSQTEQADSEQCE